MLAWITFDVMVRLGLRLYVIFVSIGGDPKKGTKTGSKSVASSDPENLGFREAMLCGPLHADSVDDRALKIRGHLAVQYGALAIHMSGFFGCLFRNGSIAPGRKNSARRLHCELACADSLSKTSASAYPPRIAKDT